VQIAIENAINYDVCHAESSAEGKLACEMDKATVNIGALFSKQVEGRVSTEVDPRLAYNTGACSFMPCMHCRSSPCYHAACCCCACASCGDLSAQRPL
jgi:hypothetical protein